MCLIVAWISKEVKLLMYLHRHIFCLCDGTCESVDFRIWSLPPCVGCTVNHSNNIRGTVDCICWIQFPVLIPAVRLDALEIYGGSHHRRVLFELSVSVTQHTDSQIIECVVGRGGACPEVSKGLWTYLFFSCETFEQAFLVHLVLSKRARGGCSYLSLFFPQGPLCILRPRGQAQDAPSVTVVKSALYVEGEVAGDVLSVSAGFFVMYMRSSNVFRRAWMNSSHPTHSNYKSTP